jgi:hypothetical protein
MKLIKEAKRLQQLAGITEITINKPGENNTKALGVLFHKDNDGDYVWDHDAMAALIKKMGYEDWFELEKEITHYTSPGDEDEMDTFKQQTGNPNLQLDDLTIGMYKEKIRNEFFINEITINKPRIKPFGVVIEAVDDDNPEGLEVLVLGQYNDTIKDVWGDLSNTDIEFTFSDSDNQFSNLLEFLKIKHIPHETTEYNEWDEIRIRIPVKYFNIKLNDEIKRMYPSLENTLSKITQWN